jgi:ATP-binding cassette, subfamily B, bacterial
MKQSKAQKLWFIFKLAPSKFVEMLLWGLFSCILSVCSVWATGHLVSLISGGFSQELLGVVIIYGVLLVLSALYSIYYKRYKVQFKVITEFERKIRTTLFKKSSKISNETYEDSFTANRIRMADGARQNLFRYVEIWISLLMAILQAFAVTAYVSSFNAWFLLLLPFSIIPPCLNLLYQTNLWKRYYKAVEQCKKEETDYLKGLIDDVACKESRLTYASELLTKKWNQSRNQRDSIVKKKSKKLLLLQLPLIPVDFVGSYGGYVVAVILLFSGKIDYAPCAAAIAAYSSIVGALSSLVSMIGYEGQYSRMIQPFFDYLAVSERSSLEKPVVLQEEITLDHVSFKYPSQEKPALEDVCLTIKKGEVVAIVGENGAGKTTLTNIILGLFTPSSGNVLYDGKNVFSVSELELHKRQSVVPQKFNRYKMTVRDNIAIGDFGLQDEKKVAEKYRAFLDGAQVKLDTLLGKEFGGRDLSGGQWQQLSCARGFYKNSDFLVLDEATSAIDPLREKAMYDAFRHELDGKTGIIVTHRLGAVPLADRIVVLVHGCIVQEGTHEELLSQDGPYLRLWKVQTRAYEEGPLE